MKLKKRINTDYMIAFKERDMLKKNLLSVIKGGIELGEKNRKVQDLSDEDVTAILNQAAKASKETISKMEDGQLKDFAKEELVIIESYLPKQMTENEIVDKINELISNGASSTGEIMRGFAGLPADRKMVSEIYLSKINKPENKIN